MTNYSDNSKAPWIKHVDSIKVVKIEDSVTTIGSHAFDSCTFLEVVAISQSVNKIYQDAFNNCAILKLIELPEKNYITEIGISAFENCYNLESNNIPESMTSINARTFANCTNLQNVNFPDKLEYLESNSFFSCRSLQTIVIPKNVNFIGDECISQCFSLNYVTFFGLSNPSHGNSVLESTQVDRVYVPAKYLDSDFCGYSVKYISMNAFTSSDIFTASSIFTQSDIFSESKLLGPTESPIATIAGITISKSFSFIVSFVSRKSVTNSLSYVSS